MKNAKRTLWLPFVLAFLVVGGCASSSPSKVFHSFGFDAIYDSPDTEILDYRYGDYRMPDWKIRNGYSERQTGITGHISVGEYLYVKWRDMKTQRVYEDTVDLRKRLPRRMKNHKVHFVASGSVLAVYLVTPDRRPSGWNMNDSKKYRHMKVYRIYPDPMLPEPVK